MEIAIPLELKMLLSDLSSHAFGTIGKENPRLMGLAFDHGRGIADSSRLGVRADKNEASRIPSKPYQMMF